LGIRTATPSASSIRTGISAFLVDKGTLIVYYTRRAIQSRGFPPHLFSYVVRVWPSGKAVVFGTTLLLAVTMAAVVFVIF
jgi:hypothetical protein